MSADRLSLEAANKKESWNAFPPESFGARPASMTEDLGPKTGHRHSLSLPNRIATLCRPLSGGGIDPGELQQPRPVLPKVQARARGWIGSGHRAFPQHAVIGVRV